MPSRLHPAAYHAEQFSTRKRLRGMNTGLGEQMHNIKYLAPESRRDGMLWLVKRHITEQGRDIWPHSNIFQWEVDERVPKALTS